MNQSGSADDRQLIVAGFLLIVIILLSGGCQRESPSISNPPTSTFERMPSRPLPSSFVGVFLPVNEMSGDAAVAYVREWANTASGYGIEVVNLMVNWKDFQPEETRYDFRTLQALIYEIKKAGMYAIVRIYANAGPNFTAWPSWLNPDMANTYFSGYSWNGLPVTNPEPWDTGYLSHLGTFFQEMANFFYEEDTVYPDAVQITAGGEYGEMVLASHPQRATLDLDRLFDAENAHVDMSVSSLGSVTGDFVLMVNSLWEGNPVVEDTVPNHAIARGIHWIQSNAGICNLIRQPYGPGNVALLKRHQDNTGIILEDESSSWTGAGSPCEGLDSSIEGRLSLISALEAESGVGFNAATIAVTDLKESNRQGIEQLKIHLAETDLLRTLRRPNARREWNWNNVVPIQSESDEIR